MERAAGHGIKGGASISIDVGNLDVKDDEDEEEEDEAGLPWLLSEKYDILVRKKEDHGKFQKAWSSRNQYMCWITRNQLKLRALAKEQTSAFEVTVVGIEEVLNMHEWEVKLKDSGKFVLINCKDPSIRINLKCSSQSSAESWVNALSAVKGNRTPVSRTSASSEMENSGKGIGRFMGLFSRAKSAETAPSEGAASYHTSGSSRKGVGFWGTRRSSRGLKYEEENDVSMSPSSMSYYSESNRDYDDDSTSSLHQHSTSSLHNLSTSSKKSRSSFNPFFWKSKPSTKDESRESVSPRLRRHASRSPTMRDHAGHSRSVAGKVESNMNVVGEIQRSASSESIITSPTSSYERLTQYASRRGEKRESIGSFGSFADQFIGTATQFHASGISSPKVNSNSTSLSPSAQGSESDLNAHRSDRELEGISEGVLASPKMMKDIVERRRSDDEAHAASQMLHSMKRLEVGKTLQLEKSPDLNGIDLNGDGFYMDGDMYVQLHSTTPHDYTFSSPKNALAQGKEGWMDPEHWRRRGSLVSNASFVSRTDSFNMHESDAVLHLGDLFNKLKDLTISGDEVRQIGTINRWQRGNLIGKGSFGEVFLGMNMDSGELFVVKQVRILDPTSEEVSQLEREIGLLSTLSHDNIVKYLGTERTTDELSVFLEYMPGGSVADLVSRFGGLDEKVIRKYTREMLEGLVYLHERGIVHRDIKGQNVLVDSKGVCKLADFGSSRHLMNESVIATTSAAVTSTGREGAAASSKAEAEKPAASVTSSKALAFKYSFKGTPVFMSPEVVSDQNYSRKSDVWGVGCTLIQMATGNPPYSEFTNHFAALFAIADKDAPPPQAPETASDDYKQLVDLCFMKNPDDRPFVEELLELPFLLRPGEAPKQPLVRSKDRSDQPPDEKDLYDNFCKTAIKSSIFASRVMSLKSALSSDEGSGLQRDNSGIDRSDLVGIYSADHSAGDGFSRAASGGSNVRSARSNTSSGKTEAQAANLVHSGWRSRQSSSRSLHTDSLPFVSEADMQGMSVIVRQTKRQDVMTEGTSFGSGANTSEEHLSAMRGSKPLTRKGRRSSETSSHGAGAKYLDEINKTQSMSPVRTSGLLDDHADFSDFSRDSIEHPISSDASNFNSGNSSESATAAAGGSRVRVPLQQPGSGQTIVAHPVNSNSSALSSTSSKQLLSPKSQDLLQLLSVHSIQELNTNGTKLESNLEPTQEFEPRVLESTERFLSSRGSASSKGKRAHKPPALEHKRLSQSFQSFSDVLTGSCGDEKGLSLSSPYGEGGMTPKHFENGQDAKPIKAFPPMRDPPAVPSADGAAAQSGKEEEGKEQEEEEEEDETMFSESFKARRRLAKREMERKDGEEEGGSGGSEGGEHSKGDDADMEGQEAREEMQGGTSEEEDWT